MMDSAHLLVSVAIFITILVGNPSSPESNRSTKVGMKIGMKIVTKIGMKIGMKKPCPPPSLEIYPFADTPGEFCFPLRPPDHRTMYFRSEVYVG